MIKHAFFVTILLATAAIAFAAGQSTERSPQGEAIALAIDKGRADIRASYHKDWWADTDSHEFGAQRIFGPGYFDSTHDFIVTYRVNGQAKGSWMVNTKHRVVGEFEPAKK